MTTLNQKSSKMNGSLTTEPDSFSDEAWSLLLIAEQSARRWRHKNLDVEHLIEVLFRNKKYQKYTNSLPINHKELNGGTPPKIFTETVPLERHDVASVLLQVILIGSGSINSNSKV